MAVNQIHPSLVKTAEDWASDFVARREIGKFTGGAFSRRYLENLDYLGKGPPGRVMLARKILYPKQQLIEWLNSKIQDPEKVAPPWENHG